MKKFLLIAALTAFTTAGSFANTTSVNSADVKTVTLAPASFSKIVVQDDIDVVLTESAEASISFDGKTADIYKVTWEVKDGVLYLKSKAASLKDKVTVTIGTQQLKELVVKGTSAVTTEGTLNTPVLTVYMYDTPNVQIKNRGHIHLENKSEQELFFSKKVGGVTYKS